MAGPTKGGDLHALDFRLSWGECDPAGIIYYATYLEWAERVHSEWWHLAGFSLAELTDRVGSSFVTRHVSCDYLRAPRAMDQLRCTMRLGRLGSSSFAMAFSFTDTAAAVEVARLDMTCVFVTGDLIATPVPATIRNLLGAS
ncbi:MAG TPA: acyl-CoA thioesterase [Acidimicrobiales bacterium]|nr:acyl-CoA thioesterase [Acidimicrobiales bacterium]